jgi:nucleoside-diphosphate-sugar epimerase
MKLTIIAATGGVGRQLLRQATDAGHDVTAVARNPANLPQTSSPGGRCGSSPPTSPPRTPRSCRTKPDARRW